MATKQGEILENTKGTGSEKFAQQSHPPIGQRPKRQVQPPQFLPPAKRRRVPVPESPDQRTRLGNSRSVSACDLLNFTDDGATESDSSIVEAIMGMPAKEYQQFNRSAGIQNAPVSKTASKNFGRPQRQPKTDSVKYSNTEGGGGEAKKGPKFRGSARSAKATSRPRKAAQRKTVARKIVDDSAGKETDSESEYDEDYVSQESGVKSKNISPLPIKLEQNRRRYNANIVIRDFASFGDEQALEKFKPESEADLSREIDDHRKMKQKFRSRFIDMKNGRNLVDGGKKGTSVYSISRAKDSLEKSLAMEGFAKHRLLMLICGVEENDKVGFNKILQYLRNNPPAIPFGNQPASDQSASKMVSGGVPAPDQSSLLNLNEEQRHQSDTGHTNDNSVSIEHGHTDGNAALSLQKLRCSKLRSKIGQMYFDLENIYVQKNQIADQMKWIALQNPTNLDELQDMRQQKSDLDTAFSELERKRSKKQKKLHEAQQIQAGMEEALKKNASLENEKIGLMKQIESMQPTDPPDQYRSLMTQPFYIDSSFSELFGENEGRDLW